MTIRTRHLRWIRHELVVAAVAAGWLPVSHAQNHHGEYSVLCEWLCGCAEAWPLEA